MKFLLGTLIFASVFFFRQSSAQQPLTKGLEEKLDSLYLIAEYSQGEGLVRSALLERISNSTASDSIVAWLHLQLGIFSQELGKYADAEDEYLNAERLYSTSLSKDHPYVGSVLSRLSVLYSEQGRFSDAKTAAEKQFSVYSTAFGRNHQYTALASIVLALQLMNSGKPDSSLQLLNEYRPIILQKFGEISKESSRLHETEGRVAFAKRDYKKAEEYFIVARKTASNTPGDRHPLTARIALALAKTRLILGNTDSALTNVNDALSVAFRASGPAHPFTAECYITKACIEEATGAIPSAFLSYRKALDVYKEATKENFRYTSERERLAFIRNLDEHLSRLASTTLRTSTFYPKGIGIFYDGLLFQKGIVLSSLQAMRRSAIESGDTTLGKLMDKLAEIRTRRSRLLSGSTTIDKPFVNQDSLAELSNTLEKELARRSQAYADLKSLGNRSWNIIAKSLPPQNICMEISRFTYYDGERRTDTTYYATLLLRQNDSSHPRLAMIRNAEIIEDSSVIRQYFRSLEKHSRKKNTSASLIAKLLWSPLEPYLENAEQIIISPDGIYDELSLAALTGEDGKLLAEHFRISTTASTADILRSLPNDSSHSITIFADPEYSAGELEPLAGTLKEAQSIETSFKEAGWEVNMFTGKNATEKNLRSIHHPSILHIATHGKFNSTTGNALLKENDPGDSYSLDNSLLNSALYFAGANTTLSRGSSNPADDGVLTALEAMGLDLQGTDLVTLSACESGNGIIQPGEGAFGLARAIRTAGARNILMSLWQVPDKETKELMISIYKNLLKNQSKSEALRNAQLEERDIVKKRYGDDIPYYWAGFVLIGF